jgi:hypothetical protein
MTLAAEITLHWPQMATCQPIDATARQRDSATARQRDSDGYCP